MNNYYKRTVDILILLALNLSSSVLAQTDLDKELITGLVVDKTIPSEENHTYKIELENGMAVIGKVTQKGIDIAITIYQPDGNLLKIVDNQKETVGVESFDITANQSGKYKFSIHSVAKDNEKGEYTLKVDKILNLSENTRRITQKELPTETLFAIWESSLTDSTAAETFIANQPERYVAEPIEGDHNNMLVTYFCIPDKTTEYVMLSGGPDFLGLRFQRLPNTKLHFVTQKVPKDARFSFGFNYFNLFKAGPNHEIESRNIRHAYDGIVEMPDAPKQIYITERANVNRGTLFPTSIKSKILNEERKITIHTPAQYNPKQPHNLVIVFDGESYGARLERSPRVPTPTIMDNLLADKKIPPTVTVLVWSMGKRSEDLISEKFGDFISTELIPWIRSNYNIHSTPDKVLLAGSSRGGFAASFIALNHSDVAGNVLSQSGSYWIKGTKNENHWTYPEDDGKLITAYKNSKVLPIKFYMDIGLYDAGASMLGMNRQFRDILIVKGYDVDYREFKGGHHYVNWRGTLSDGLISLMGVKRNQK